MELDEALALAREIAESLGGRQAIALERLCREVEQLRGAPSRTVARADFPEEDTRPEGVVGHARRSSKTFAAVRETAADHFRAATEELKKGDGEG